MTTGIDRAQCEDRDRAAGLAALRSRFHIPDGVVNLDGNSLGSLPLHTPRRVAEVVEQEWGEGLVRSWRTAHWMEAPQRIGDKIARLVGALPGEVVVADSTTVCIYKLVRAGLSLRNDRRVVLTEAENFHTDIYVASAAAAADGASLEVVPRADLEARLAHDDVGVLMLTHVDFRSGAMHDMAAMSAAAHRAGAVALWDLSHSTCAVPLALEAHGADLAVGCGYKYLNGGPGAPAFMYARTDLHEDLRTPVPGWIGHAAPFAFEPEFRPASGMQSLLSGTPPVLALAALECAVDLWLEVDMATVRAASVSLTEVFIELVEERCAGAGFRLVSPRAAAQRGSQVAYAHPEAYGIVQALLERGVIADFRAPDVCRFGFAPLYVRHVDVWDAVDRLCGLLESGAHRNAQYVQRAAIT